jgi:hypothetical protein
LCSLFIKGRAKKVAPKSMKTKSHNQACPFWVLSLVIEGLVKLLKDMF